MEVMSYKKCLSIKREDGFKMRTVDKYTMPAALRCTVSRNLKRPFMSIYRDDEVITYGKFNFYVQNTAAYFANQGIIKGNRIAIIGESCPNWMIAYFAITSLGAIAIPVLPDFSAKEMIKILNHSESRALIIASKHFEKILPFVEEHNEFIFRLDDLFHIPSNVVAIVKKSKEFSIAAGVDSKKVNRKIADDKMLEEFEKNVLEEDIASIIYTSGTTGTSKGVVLTHKNLVWDADVASLGYAPINPGDRCLSILPVSHVYEFTTVQMVDLMNGARIYFLGKPPAASILLPALQEIKPKIILTVPLLMEKVYRSSVLPVLKNNKTIKGLYKNPLTKKLISRVIGRKLLITFGGRIKFFGLGGAPLDPEVESFLYDAKFPYSIGYGLTETSPLIAGCSCKYSDHVKGTIGKALPGVNLKIDNPDPKTGIGEILIKGPCVMKGYYKNDELTKESFTEDGFFKTGDLGVFDKKKRLSLKGRSKTMILGSGGENIYPESIESIINNQDFVQESLVIEDGTGLMALIKIDIDSYSKMTKLSVEDAKKSATEYINKLKKEINKELNSFSRIHNVSLQEEPFQRTPTQKIKRFIYSKTGLDKNKDKGDKDDSK
ncbi:MAG: AMP-binding protein [Spirochaetaceae bacterium]|nr:AMP-binding protein [Spirochaetaceae bacterium]